MAGFCTEPAESVKRLEKSHRAYVGEAGAAKNRAISGQARRRESPAGHRGIGGARRCLLKLAKRQRVSAHRLNRPK